VFPPVRQQRPDRRGSAGRIPSFHPRWPEKWFVTLDVFVCNLNCDNRVKARLLVASLVALFQPKDKRFYEVERA
jgi:hypothetical protein